MNLISTQQDEYWTRFSRKISANLGERSIDLIHFLSLKLEGEVKSEIEAMEVESSSAARASDDYDEVMNDPAFLQSVLETLPGVDPSSDAVQSAVVALRNQEKDKKQEKKPEPK